MEPPILPEKAEAIILYYMELHYLRLRGDIHKIYLPLQIKARELGFGPAMAWRLIRFGRRIGMVDCKKGFR